MARKKASEKTGKQTAVITGLEMLRLAACAMLNVACNILSSLFSPLAGIAFAIGGIVCWILSLKETAALRERLVKHKVVTLIAGTALIVLLTYTALGSYRAVRREWPTKGQAPCGDTGPAVASGTGNVAISGCGNDLSSGKPK